MLFLNYSQLPKTKTRIFLTLHQKGLDVNILSYVMVQVHTINPHSAQGYNWSPPPGTGPPPYFIFSKNAIIILCSVSSISSEVLDWAFIFIPKFAHFDCPFFMLIRETIWVCEDCVIATADHTCCMHAQKGQKFSEKAIFIAYL